MSLSRSEIEVDAFFLRNRWTNSLELHCSGPGHAAHRCALLVRWTIRQQCTRRRCTSCTPEDGPAASIWASPSASTRPGSAVQPGPAVAALSKSESGQAWSAIITILGMRCLLREAFGSVGMFHRRLGGIQPQKDAFLDNPKSPWLLTKTQGGYCFRTCSISNKGHGEDLT